MNIVYLNFIFKRLFILCYFSFVLLKKGILCLNIKKMMKLFVLLDVALKFFIDGIVIQRSVNEGILLKKLVFVMTYKKGVY